MSELNEKQMYSPVSIFIPRVETSWAYEEKMSDIFEKFNIGQVERIDFVEKIDKLNNVYYQAFVHFKLWYHTEISYNIQNKIKNQKQVKFVYDHPSYWIILKNKNPMTEIEVKLEKRIIQLEKENINYCKVNLMYLNRIINLETQVYQLQSKYWNNQMEGITFPLIPPKPKPLKRQTNSHEVNFNCDDDCNLESKIINTEDTMQYETNNYIDRRDYDVRKIFENEYKYTD